MALLYTYAMLLNKLTEDLDLVNEPFISADELLGYMNEAIEEAETAIHTLGIEDTYFLATDFIYLIPGQSQYNLPADIYANKIRKMFYSNPTTQVVTTGTLSTSVANVTVASATGISQGNAVFGTGIPQTTKVVSVVGSVVTLSNTPTIAGLQTLTFVSIQPVNGARRYEVCKIRSIQDTMYFYPGDDYRFIIQNLPQAAGGNQLQIYPVPQETGALIQVWYIRELHRLTTSTTDTGNVCELPECVNFVFQHVKWRVAKKRRIAEVVASEEAALTKQYALMQETFKEMVPDGNNKIQLDLSAYFNQELDLYY
jgi:hypothetical protein